MQLQPGKRFHAERQQRFADVKPRKLFAFEYNHAPPGAGEQRSGRASGRSAAYDGDIVNLAAHRLDRSKLAKACRSKKPDTDTRLSRTRGMPVFRLPQRSMTVLC